VTRPRKRTWSRGLHWYAQVERENVSMHALRLSCALQGSRCVRLHSLNFLYFPLDNQTDTAPDILLTYAVDVSGCTVYRRQHAACEATPRHSTSLGHGARN
jgi:hypothetical protein